PGPARLPAGPAGGRGGPEHGPFAGLHRTRAQVRAALAGRPALVVTMRGPLDAVDEVTATAKELDAVIVLMPLSYGEDGPGVVRAALRARDRLPEGTLVVPVPLARREGPETDLQRREHVPDP